MIRENIKRMLTVPIPDSGQSPEFVRIADQFLVDLLDRALDEPERFWVEIKDEAKAQGMSATMEIKLMLAGVAMTQIAADPKFAAEWDVAVKKRG